MTQSANDRLVALIQSDPEAAVALLEEIAGTLLRPHSDGQREVLDSERRFLTLCAGRRWGKTKVGAAKAVKKAKEKKRIVWWVAPTYKIVKRGYDEVVAQIPKQLLAKPPQPSAAFDAGRSVILEFKNGSRIEFYSAERPEGMLGGSSDFVIMDEAATMPEHVWTQYVRPVLADRQGGALFISTPRGKNWYYRMWALGQDELETDYQSWRFPSFTNPTIPESEFLQMEAELPRVVYEQEILADFVSAAAQVFRMGENAIQPLHKPEGHVILGIDLAKHRDFSVLYAVRAGDRKPCYHDRFNAVSWPDQRRRIHSCIEKLERDGATGVTVLLDSTGVGDVVYDDLSFEGLDVIGIKFTNQWKQLAVQLLAADLERDQAFILPEMVKEFEGYGYSISEATGRWKFEAMSGHDDEVSAALLTHWGVVQEGVPDVMMLSAGSPGLPAGDDVDEAEVVEGELVVEQLPAPPSQHHLLVHGWH